MPRILLIDDESDLVEMCALALQSQGHDAQTATDGLLGIDLALRSAFDLIVLDWVMPQMPGDELFRWFRNHPLTHSIPVLMISASDHAENEAESLGVDAFLPKPFTTEDLLAAVVSTLEHHRLTIEHHRLQPSAPDITAHH